VTVDIFDLPPEPNRDAVRKGADDALSSWLAEHPFSFGDLIRDAAKEAITEWLDEHCDQLIDHIRDAAA
jgi:hypothetical protein